MEEDIEDIQRKLKSLGEEIARIQDSADNILTYKTKTNKRICNLEKEVNMLKNAFEELCSEKEACEKKIKNSTIENSISQTIPKVLDSNKTIIVRKGEKWRYHNLNVWLECKLKLKNQWTIKNFGHKVMHKQVEFSKFEYKHFILSKKNEWDKEGIWIWEDLLTLKCMDPKIKLIDYGSHQKRHGKHIILGDNCLYVNGQQYVWDNKTNRVTICKEVK